MNGDAGQVGGGPALSHEQALQHAAAAFSTGWLAAANAVGAFLAVLLLRPAWGAYAGEWTYGRWMALHLNWQLYGWCSLPAVGLLLKRCLRLGDPAAGQARWALFAWSLALALGGVSWLQGETSGKLFLDWAGLPRLFFIAMLAGLWGLLAWNVFRVPRTTDDDREAGAARPAGRLANRVLLAALALVPGVLYWSAGRRVYPAIDPGTGGPTGASLLGSTLVIVLVIAMTPPLLGIPRRKTRGDTGFWVLFGLDAGIFLLVNHGNSSHADWRQAAALGSLLIWVPALAWRLGRFAWPPASVPWRRATLCWWSALVVTGFASFLPGWLDRIKFTHALVAHAHLAMAGLLTSLNMLILLNLAAPAADALAALRSRAAFLCWHGGLLVQLTALGALAAMEVREPGRLFNEGDPMLYGLRLLGGMLMTGASVYWAGSVGRSWLTQTREAA